MLKVFRFLLLMLSSVTMATAVLDNPSVATTWGECGVNTEYGNPSQIQSPKEKAKAYYAAAYDCYSPAYAHDLDFYYRDAIDYYNDAINLNLSLSKTYLSYTYLGDIHQQLREYQLAFTNFDRAVKLIPGAPIAYIYRGRVYEKLEQYQKAFLDYSKAIQVDSNSAPTYIARGKVLEELNKNQDALKDYNRAIDSQPYWIEAYLARGGVYQKLDRHQNAINDYTKAIALINDFTAAYFKREDLITGSIGHTLAEAYRKRGDVYREMKEYPKAMEDFSDSSFLQPLPPKFYLSRGETYRELGDYQKALNDYVRAMAKNEPIESANAYLGIGYVYRDLQKQSEAINSFKQAAYLFEQQGNIDLYQTAMNEINKLE